MLVPRLLRLVPLALILLGCRSTPRAEPQTPDTEDLPEAGSWEAKPSQTGGETTGNPSGPPVVNYPGFEVLNDGRSVVSIQVRGPVQVTEMKVEGRIVYALSGVAVPERVNRLPLLTQHFPTQVTAVTVEQTPTGANLIMETREPATSTFSIKQNQAGSLVSIVIPRSEKYGTKDPTTDPTNFERPTEGPGTDPATNEPGEGYSRETERRRKKSKRQPKPHVERALTLPHKTLAPDISIAALGYDEGTPITHLSSGIRYGIVDAFEVEATPHSFRLAPDGAFTYPSLGFTAGYTGDTFEIAGRARYFLGIDTDLDDVNAGVLTLGAPMQIHLSKWGRIDTGIFTTLDLDGVGRGSTFTQSPNSDVQVGLYQLLASPLMVTPGIPFYFLFQPVPEFWFGVHNGLTIQNFDNVEGDSLRLPVGLEAGITASDEFNPVADLAIHLDFPAFFVPLRGDDVVEEKAYQLAAVFRWFYHL